MTKQTKKKAQANKEQEVLEPEVQQKETDAPQEEEVKDTHQEKQVEEVQEKEQVETEEEKDPIAELEHKVETLNDKYLRLTAEYDNYRKRTLKEKMELTKSAGASMILALLPVIDDFDRALAHLDEAKDLDAVKEGIKLIYNKFQDFLSQQGISEIEAKDKDFDTDHHEAITKIPAPAEDLKGKVIDCVEKGYMLNDKVIRFSKVVVGE
jgi:molecular chaperone GrpE